MKTYPLIFKLIGRKACFLIRSLILLQLVFLKTTSSVYSEVHEQDGKIKLELTNSTLVDALKQIQKQTEFRFIFNHDDLSGHQVNLTVSDAEINKVLDRVFADKPFNYTINGKAIIISANKNMTKQQDKGFEIKGNIKDPDGHPLPGATIRIDGTSLGTSTDEKGNFKLLATEIPVKLIISFIGMETRTITVEENLEVNITLKYELEDLEEVVITGIFQKSKESYTGAVTTITEKELKMFGNRDLLTTIRNIDPSFNIIVNNDYGSDPNRLPEIQIRGNASLPTVKDIQEDNRVNVNLPVFILDGFEISLQQVMDLNDQNIETITLLKDASATALYGSRGANGVVVITSKLPEPGALRVSYRGNLNIEIPDLSAYDVLNAREKLQLEYDAGTYNAGSIDMHEKLQLIYHQKLAEVEKGVDTYWLSKPLQTGVGQRHDLRLDGGDKMFRYTLSLSYNNIVGVMKKSLRETFNGGITLSYYYKNIIFTNYLNIGLNRAKNSPYGFFNEYVEMNPYYRTHDEKGNILFLCENTDFGYEFKWKISNPLYNSTLNTFNKSDYTLINNNFSIEWKILPELKIRARIGVSKQLNGSDDYKPADHTAFKDYELSDYFRKGTYTYGSGKSYNYNIDFTADYSKTWGQHILFGGFNYKLSENKSYNYSFMVEGFTHESMDFLSMARQYYKDGSPGGRESLTRSIGFTGNLTYSFKNRYILDGSFRMDGSSQFGSNKRFAPFWSVGAAWNLHNENFFPGSAISLLKLRGSFGVTGSNNFSAYQSLRTYSYYSDERYRMWNGVYLMGIGNEDLKWQQTRKVNIGLDLSLWNNRVMCNVNIYRNMTSNLLSEMELPLSNGFNSYIENIGKVSNTGFEISTGVYIIRNSEKEMTWQLIGSMHYNRNKIEKISDALKAANEELEKTDGSNPNFMYREGEATNTIYTVKSLGIDPANGREIFLTRNGERTYIWDYRDKVNSGVPEKYRGNINTAFRYKGLTANISFGFRFGGKLYNNTLISKVENADIKKNVDRRVYEERWIRPGDVTFFKDVNDRTPTKMTSRFVQKENTLECQNINLGYEFTKNKFLNSLHIQSLMLQSNMADIFRVSSIKQERGIFYPFSRKISFSISAIF